MLESWVRLRHRALGLLGRVACLGPLLARLSLGWVFAQTGWGKLHNLERVIGFFTDLGIPNPEFQARFVASHELVCGVLLMLGLATRLAAVPLIIIMSVALSTAVQFEGPMGLLASDEFGYIAIFVWLLQAGPGRVSVDALLVRLLEGRRPRSG